MPNSVTPSQPKRGADNSLSPRSRLANWQRWSPQQIGGFGLIVAFLLVYWATLDTGLQPYELRGGDLITHQYAQVQARPSNAPGYPLYTMGGWLWFHVGRGLIQFLGNDFPNPMPILSSYSTLWGLIALWLFYCIVLLILRDDEDQPMGWSEVGIALLLTAFYGSTYFFWYYATTTEQYSSAVAQTLALVYLYLRWERMPQRLGLLYGLAFLSGLSLAHMLTVAFIVPPLVGVVIWRKPELLRNGRAIVGSVAAAALPLLSYVYVYVRGALNPQWWGNGDWPTPQAWFWSFVATAQGREELSWAFDPGRPRFGNGFPQLIWQELSIPLLIFGLVGIGGLKPRWRWLLWGTLVIYAVFCWVYRFGNWFQVILPAYPLILLGLLPWYQRARSRFTATPSQRLAVPTVTLVALTIALAWRVSASLPAADNRNRPEDTALDHAALLLDQPLPQNAGLFAAVDDALALNYLLEIWQLPTDALIVSSGTADSRVQLDQMVLSTFGAVPTLLEELSTQTFLQSVGADWVQVAHSAPTSFQTVAERHTIMPGLDLISATVEAAPQGDPVQVTPAGAFYPALDVVLSWELSDGNWPADVQISVRPLHSGNQFIDPATDTPIQQDRPRPVHGLYQDLPPRERTGSTPVVVHDGYRLPLPPSIASEADGILVIVYRATETGFENLAEIVYSFDPATIGLAQ